MAYAKHQSFYLKSNWINKGLKAVDNNSLFFSNVDNFLEIGIGKNMFFSLRYWLEALNLIEFNASFATFTDFGKFVYENDLSCNKPLTLNLMHYFLTLNKPVNRADISTGFYWFFNIDNSKISTKTTLVLDLVKWDTTTFHRNTSENTIERDIDCLILTYSKKDKAHPEDKNTSVLARLNLISKDKDQIKRETLDRNLVSKKAIMYIILRLIEDLPNREHNFISLNDLLEETMSPGKLFHLGRVDLIEILEEMINEKYPLQIIRTNNLDTITVATDQNSNDFLKVILREEGKL